MASVIGTTRLNAATPIARISTWRISSVAYADEEMQSDENTATVVGMPRRSCSSWSVVSAGPRMRRFMRYAAGLGELDPGAPGRQGLRRGRPAHSGRRGRGGVAGVGGGHRNPCKTAPRRGPARNGGPRVKKA